MKTKFAIIGGGVAGLSAAIRLAELGEEPLVIESGSYPAHKICGEFLSPECIKYLNEWNTYPVEITQTILHSATSNLIFPFASPAGGLSHLELEPSLVKHALQCGVKILTNISIRSFIQKKRSNDSNLIHLSNDEMIESSNVIIAAGKFNASSTPPKKRYMGFKTHFENINAEIAHLEMFSFPGAYLGVSPIENSKINVACIAELNKIGSEDPQLFIQNLISQNTYLQSLLVPTKNLFKEWMVASIPDFGLRHTPQWADCYFIGDAAMSIPPACGNGLSLALFGGRLAAEYAIQQKPQEFKSLWKKRCASQLFWAKMLHRLMLNPGYSTFAMQLSKYFMRVPHMLFERTRFSIKH